MNPAAVQAAYARAFGMSGPAEVVQMVRSGDGATYTAVGWPPPEVTVTDLAGGERQARRFVIVLASAAAASGFPLPFRVKQDRLKWAGGARTSAITKVGERRVQGQIVAYELDIEGA